MAFMLAPVEAERGRKSRGFACLLSARWTSLAYGMDYESAKMWDSDGKKVAHANAAFCGAAPGPEDELEAARQAYASSVAASAVTWCKSVKPELSDGNLASFARNVLRKQHPELLAYARAALPDKRDAVKEVESALKWAQSLWTRPMVLCRRSCLGGKLHQSEKAVQIAMRALEKKGVTELDGFSEALGLALLMAGLPKPACLASKAHAKQDGGWEEQ